MNALKSYRIGKSAAFNCLFMGIRINTMMSSYRKIWENANGIIPLDENGITYEIHHKDNDHTNNDLDNLQCMNIQDHYNIHFNQGNYKACILIATRLNDPEKYKISKERSRIKNVNYQRKRVADGTHHLLSGEIQKKNNAIRVANGTHNFLDSEQASIRNKKLVNEGKHCLLKQKDGSSIGGTDCKRRIVNGTHHFLDSKMQTELAQRAKLVNQKPVLQIDPDTNSVIKEYVSTQEILKLHPDFKSTIYCKIKSGTLYKGFIWKSI